MDKWLTRKKGPTTETPATTTNKLISEDAFDDRTGDCSTTMCSSDLDASTDVSVVTSQVASIAGASHVESDEVSDVERQSGRKHDSSDCNTTSSKKRKYDDNYISLGFTCINIGGFSRPQCVICAKALSQNSMKPSLLRRHLETNHPHLKNKPREYFERQLKSLLTSKTCIQVPDLMNKNRLQASYMVSYRVAKNSKPHTFVEDLILPAALDMVGTIWGKRQKKTIQSIPSSNNTVSRRINAMSENLLQQLLLRIRHSEFYAIQLDESTDVAGLVHLLYVRYIHEGTIKEDMLFCKPLEERITATDIFQKLDTFMNTHGLVWDRCVGICTDGARAITGRHGDVVSRVQAVAPDASWVHCSIHREALAAKGIPVRLKHVRV
ncbi:zinc finger BED domain-containing protein 5-like [Simochromis diagramma]|uniref:zinc finger BED domain-containing protein 5-like n=1 Tax=Simochromis diagramma TaxID=43689 RepID=UPI001A7F02E5|nr:zinc finger BED domain-containing protein 5-like [Simochromis diagramma]